MNNDKQKVQESDELDEGQLESVVGGVMSTPILDQDTQATNSTVLKTRHDTAKNSISNVR